jgi:ubiquinone/menaquinone biosynthesis C-methylase UbiE
MIGSVGISLHEPNNALTEIDVSSITVDKRFWDRAATKYARDPIKDLQGYERTVERTRELLQGAESVLEVGCGTGTTALSLARSVKRITATDLSGEMIAIARGKAASQGCGNVDFIVAPANAPPADAQLHDAVLAFNLLHLVEDRGAVLANLGRHLKPGGLLVTKTPCLADMNPLIRLAVPVMRLLGKAPTVSFFGAKDLAREIELAGFAIEAHEWHGSGRRDTRPFIVARKPQAPPASPERR